MGLSTRIGHPRARASVGRRLRAIAHPPATATAPAPPAGPTRRRRRWMTVAAGAIAVVVLGGPLAVAVIVVALAVWRVLRRRRDRRRHERLVVQGLPDALALALMAARAGAGVSRIVEVLAVHAPAPFADGASAVLARRDAGERLAVALGHLRATLGDPVTGLVAALVAAERDGAPLAPPLSGALDAARRARRLDADARARRLPVTLLFPLVVCVLPAFVALGVAPVLIGALRDLTLDL